LEFDPAPNLAIFKIPGGSWFHGEGWGTATGSNCLFWNLETDPNFFSEQKRKHPDDVGELGQVLDGMQSFNRALPKSQHFAGRASAVGSHQRPLHLVHFSLTRRCRETLKVKSWTGQKWIAYG